jgi:hypothetical protein
MNGASLRLAAGFALGICLGAVCSFLLFREGLPAVAETSPAAEAVPSTAAELEAIKSKLPDQAHAMQDVGYHFSNLWFAGQRQAWDLANFFWLETRSHLQWAVRIIPVRKDNAGVEIRLVDILVAMENGPLKQLGEAIAAKDPTAFERAYRFSLENCYACHKASDKPFIRLQIPALPETSIITFDPAATWPR